MEKDLGGANASSIARRFRDEFGEKIVSVFFEGGGVFFLGGQRVFFGRGRGGVFWWRVCCFEGVSFC